MDLRDQIERYITKDPEEEAAKKAVLSGLTAYGDDIRKREGRCEAAHFTVSAMVLTPEMDKALMVFHSLYQSFSWPGGHADGEADLFSAALREVFEETGAQEVYPLTGRIVSLDVLPVKAHKRKGADVAAHVHYNAAYGFIAPEKQILKIKPDENSGVEWIAVSELAARCGEPHMLPVYEKIMDRMKAISRKKKESCAKLTEPVLQWYKGAARALPWREGREPYKVWISEIMLQQTRVEAVRGYFERFLSALPSIEALAKVEDERLLKLWEGLGYYNRARNLKKAAGKIMEEHNGVFPSEYSEILALPGIGDYTAGAVASICFGEPVPAVDGNVLRVMARVTERFESIDRLAIKKEITGLLAEVYPSRLYPDREDSAFANGTFTQALMELGAIVCVPGGPPKCGICPLREFCMAYESQTQRMLPVKAKKKPRRIEEKTVFMLTRETESEKGRCYAVRRRAEGGLLSGLFELPNAEGKMTPEQALAAAADWGVNPVSIEKSRERSHIFSHVEWHMTCYYLCCGSSPENGQVLWVDKEALRRQVALPTAFKMFLEE